MKTIRLSGACEVVPSQASTSLHLDRAQSRHRHWLAALPCRSLGVGWSLLLALFLLALPAAVCAQTQGLIWTTNADNTITITDYLWTIIGTNIIIIDTNPVVDIPRTIAGLPVTGIGAGAFHGWRTLTSLTIPNSVTNIGDLAFSGCTSLTNVTIPNSVIYLGEAVFIGCTNLANVVIPDRITLIKDATFDSCSRLTSVTIPSLVTSIGGFAFYGCSSLTKVIIPNSVTAIYGGAFLNCTSLTSIAIPAGVTNAGFYVGTGCDSMKTITVDALNPAYSSVDGVLFNKQQTTLIECPGGKAGNYTVPNTVTGIGGDAFAFCYSLTNVTIPNSVTNIGDEAFYHCTNLTTVTIGNNLTCIGENAFAYTMRLISIFFHGNAPTLGDDVFDASPARIYYLPGTTGWGPVFGERPTALWRPRAQSSDSTFGIRTNQFGFNIVWASGMTVIVEASTSLTNPNWIPVATNTLTADSWYFTDPNPATAAGRFYRLRIP